MADDFAVLYRWRITPGMEEQFQEGWRRVTVGILERCGSFGSRLHLADDGTWVAYARWPSAEARDACSDLGPVDPEASAMMRAATAHAYDDILMTVSDDLLREPRA